MKNEFQVNAENYASRHRKKIIWYRILSILCCIVVFCTTYAMVLPAITLEEDGGTTEGGSTEAAEDPSGIVMSKLIKYDEATKGFTIRIESFVTGSTQIITKPQLVDIVLVLDASYSMELTGSFTVYTPVYNVSTNGTYYYMSDGQYRRAYYCNTCREWYTSAHTNSGGGGSGRTHNINGTKITPKTSEGSSTGVQFYSVSNMSYLTALKSAVASFIDNIAAVSADNRVAIVKFASGDSRYVQTDVTKTGNTQSYTQVVQGLTKLSATNVSTLKSSVNAIQAGGNTASDYGLQLAQGLLANAKADAADNKETYDRQQVVVMFTDGAPNHSGTGSMETSVANDAIAKAKTIKAEGTTIYTIGCLEGADATIHAPGTTGWSNLSNVNKYMNLVSSNFPAATSLTSTGNAAYPVDGSSYYKVVSEAGGIIDSFDEVSIEIGKAAVQLDEATELKDYISEQFNLTETARDDVYVHTETFNGKNDKGELLWVDDNNGPRPTGLTVTVEDGIKREGATGLVSVTGFDYSEYYVDLNAEPGATHKGKKLVVDIPIAPNPDAEATGMVKTNAPGSGLYNGGELVGEEFPFPEVEAPADINIKLSSSRVADIENNSISIKATGATDAAAYNAAAKEFGSEIKLSDTTETSFNLGGKNGLTSELFAIDHIAKEETPIDVVFDISNIPEGYVLYAKLDDNEKVVVPSLSGSAQYKLQPTGTMNLEFILEYSPYTTLTVVNETLGTTAEDLKFTYDISYKDYDGETVTKRFTLDMNKSTAELEAPITELAGIPLNNTVTIKESGYEGFTVLYRNTDGETLTAGDTYTLTMSDDTTIIVQNNAGKPLPSTGSSGALIITIIGISLIAFAGICALVLLLNKRLRGVQNS